MGKIIPKTQKSFARYILLGHELSWVYGPDLKGQYAKNVMLKGKRFYKIDQITNTSCAWVDIIFTPFLIDV